MLLILTNIQFTQFPLNQVVLQPTCFLIYIILNTNHIHLKEYLTILVYFCLKFHYSTLIFAKIQDVQVLFLTLHCWIIEHFRNFFLYQFDSLYWIFIILITYVYFSVGYYFIDNCSCIYEFFIILYHFLHTY